MKQKIKTKQRMALLLTILGITALVSGGLISLKQGGSLQAEAVEIHLEEESEILAMSESPPEDGDIETGNDENTEDDTSEKEEVGTFEVVPVEAGNIIYGQKSVEIAEITDSKGTDERNEVKFLVEIISDTSGQYSAEQNFEIKEVTGRDNTYSVKFDAVAVGTVKFMIKKKSDIYYDEKMSDKVFEINIARRPLYLQTGDAVKHWNENTFTEQVKVNFLNDNGYCDKDKNSGFVSDDKVNLYGRLKMPDVIIDETNCGMAEQGEIGVYRNAVTFDSKSGNATENYVFKIEPDNQGTLIIDGEAVKNAADYLAVDNEKSTHVYQDENHQLYFGGDSDIQAVLKLQQERYTKIKYKQDTGYVELEADKTLILDTGVFDQTVEFILSTEDGKQQTQPFLLTFKRDNTNPDVSIKIGKTKSVVTQFVNAIPFSFFGNGKGNTACLQAEINVTDRSTTNHEYNEEVKCSGIKSWSYLVVNTVEDVKFGKDVISAMDDNVKTVFSGYSFTEVDASKVNEKLTIDIGKVNEETMAGNYIIFVLASDNVGNTVLYSSNGIVIDDINPASVKVEYSGTESKNKPEFFNEAVNLKATVTENTKRIFSGVKDLAYTATRDGKTEDVHVVFDNAYPSSTLDELKDKYKENTSYFKIEPDRDSEGNSYSREMIINFTAHDFAGNELTQTKSFVIDPVIPTVKNTVASKAEKLNGKYYKEDVIVTTEITERFLDIQNDVIYSIKADEQASESLTLAQLQKPQNKSKYGISDVFIEHETNQTNRTDKAVSTITITFSGEHDYIIHTYAKDMAGNKAEAAVEEFVIDKTAPVVTMTYYKYSAGEARAFEFVPYESEAAPIYLNEKYNAFKVDATVDELNFSQDNHVNAKFDVVAKDSSNKVIYKEMTDKIATDVRNVVNVQNNEDIWKTEDHHSYTYEVQFTEDANYSFSFDYTDLAGNKAEIKPVYITLDKTKPTGSVTLSGLVNGAAMGTWQSFISKITFNFFAKNSIGGSMTSEDATAGVLNTQYYVTNQLMTKTDLENLKDAQWTDYIQPLTFTANHNVLLYEKVVDKAGNIAYFSSENVIIDNEKPVVAVTITPSSPVQGGDVYSAGDEPGFDIRVKDVSATADQNAYSGLNRISYKIVNSTTGYAETGVLALFDRTAHQSEWTGHVNINPELFYSNDVQVTVTASDWSTNKVTSETTTLKVDNKAPMVKFSFDTSDALNGKYYKNNKTLTITVEERNFDTSYTPTVTSSAGGGYTFSGWSSNGELHTGTVTFSGDSDYTVTFDCVDLAGNKSNTENLSEFTVDKTLPVINVSYNNNSAQNGNYYKESRTATITITEHNFNASEVRVTTTAALNGTSIAAPTVSGWSTSGDRHTAMISYAKDGDFTFDITYSDLAGNVAADYATDRFTVDLTNPEIKFSGVTDKSSNKGTVAPVIDLTDTNFNTQGVTLTLTGTKKGKVSTEGMMTVTTVGNGQRITFRNFVADMDDVYTLTAKSVDKAGNETSKTLTFSVNRDGSNYILGEATKKLVESGFTNKPQDIVITEINVDTLEFIELSYSKDGEIVKLVEGKDFSVRTTGGNGQWKQYIYTIKASCFEEEGSYILNIYSVDRAENEATNKSKNSPVEFIVDKTVPTMSVANLENRGRYKENAHEFTLTVKDNMVLSYVEVYLDGELWHSYTADELSVADGQLVITVDSKNAYQDVKIIAYDAAGNVADPVEYQVLVTSNMWIQFFMNKIFFWSLTAVIFVLLICGIILSVRYKRKSEK